MECRLSEPERVYLISGAVDNERTDGRTTDDMRPIGACELDPISSCHGSARLRIGRTDVLVGVKAILNRMDCGNKGQIHFSVDCSANATPQFEGKGGGDFGASTAAALSEAFENSFDYTALCIRPDVCCWTLYCDALILEFDGLTIFHLLSNATDVASLACLLALAACKLPRVAVREFHDECAKPEIELCEPDELGRSDAAAEMSLTEVVRWMSAIGATRWMSTEFVSTKFMSTKLLVNYVCSHAPQLVTVSKLGVANVVDLTTEEEQCAMAAVIFGVAPASTPDENGSICLVKQMGKGSLDSDSLDEMMRLAVRSAMQRRHLLRSFLHSGKLTMSD